MLSKTLIHHRRVTSVVSYVILISNWEQFNVTYLLWIGRARIESEISLYFFLYLRNWHLFQQTVQVFLRDQVVIFVVEILRRQAQHFILVIEIQMQAQQKWDIWKAWKAQKLLSEWEKLMFRRNFFGDIIELNKHYFKHNFIQLAIDVSQHKDKPFHFDQLVNF